jgi:hypothetical protein
MSGTITAPYAGFVGLAVGGAEVSGGSYVREPVNLVTSADGVTLANDATIEWPIATADWGIIDHVQIWDAATAGTSLVTLSTHVPLAIAQYAIARIPDAGMTLEILQTPPRKYSLGPYSFGPFSTNRNLAPTTVGAPSAWGVGPYGTNAFGIAPAGVLLELTFDTSTHVCEPGTWLPGPFGWKQAA